MLLNWDSVPETAMTQLGLPQCRKLREEFLNFCRAQPAPLTDSRFAVEGRRCSFWLGTLCELSKSKEPSTRLHRPTANETRALALDKYRAEYKDFNKASACILSRAEKNSILDCASGFNFQHRLVAENRAPGSEKHHP